MTNVAGAVSPKVKSIWAPGSSPDISLAAYSDPTNGGVTEHMPPADALLGGTTVHGPTNREALLPA